jgi:hypothetical protein
MIYLINDGWLMMSWGIKSYPLYIGDYFIIQEREIPIKSINQPGLNGITEGF